MKYAAIYADPPWRFRTWSETNQAKAASRHYNLMTLPEIAALPVADMAAVDCALFMWCVNPMLPQALEVMAAWGFTFKTIGFVWAKTTRRSVPSWAPRWHFGLGYWTRANCEYCLIGTRGKPQRMSMSEPQLIVSPIREHSRKPDEVRASIERLVPGPYLELFARTRAPRWDIAYSDQADRFAEVAA